MSQTTQNQPQTAVDKKKTIENIVIIGGVAGGASFAARARRLDENARITLIERGPDVSFANCGLPYFIGGEITDRSRLAVQTPESLQAMLNLEVKTRTEALSIDRERKVVKTRNIETGAEAEEPYDRLVLAPGAAPIRPPMPGIEHDKILTLRNLQDMDRINTAAETAQDVLIIGAGFIGLEMAEQLVRKGKSVTVVELQPQVLPVLDPDMTRPVEDELRSNGVDLVLGDGIKQFREARNRVEAELNSGRQVASDLVVLSIGVRPENRLAQDADLEIGPRGHVLVNEFQQTSDPAIYAVGDVVETKEPVFGEQTAVPLGGPANRQGRLAADHIFRPNHAQPYPGSLGTAIVRVFDLAVGLTGWSEKRLEQTGKTYRATTVTDFHHAGYFPGAVHLTMKILWDPTDGRLLGGQAFGPEGVDKRLDILATAIRGKMTIDDLAQLELSYAPPFGAAKDVINIAGFAAQNVRDGLVEVIDDWPENEDMQLLDARPAALAEISPMPGAKNIPIAELRDRLDELDRSKPVVTACALGKMSYFAARILGLHGFTVKSLSGGMKMHPQATGNSPADSAGVNGAKKAEPEPSVNLMEKQPDEKVHHLDATGLACPGPIMRVREAVKDLSPGETLEVQASDAGFASDLPAFCKAARLEFLGVEKSSGIITGRLRKTSSGSTQEAGAQIDAGAATLRAKQGATLVVFSCDLDKVLASFVIANGAAAMGGSVTMFFTFWGLNALRKENLEKAVEGKTFMDNMFGAMMPRGAGKLGLSRMHMGGMGTGMMKSRMARKNLPNLPDLMRQAQESGVRMVACSMSMEAMGLRQDELLDGVEIGGVAEFLGAAGETPANLFI